jgi:group I intron endonuclease
MAISGIYSITNKNNGNKYIGSAVHIKHRWNCHISDLNKNKHHSIYLQRAWDKYGADCFEFSVIEYCEKDKLIEREQFFIDIFCPTYNILPTAGSCLGMKHSDEAKKKNALAHMGNSYAVLYMRSDEARKKFSAIHKGKIVSEETRKKISLAHKGHIASDETKEKMSKARKGKKLNPLSPETREKISLAGMGNKNAIRKLNWTQVEEIRTRYIPGILSQKKLAEEYGVTHKVIGDILNNKAWKVKTL